MEIRISFSAKNMSGYNMVLKEVGLAGMDGLRPKGGGFKFTVTLPNPGKALELLEKLEKVVERENAVIVGDILTCYPGDLDIPEQEIKKLEETAARINKKVGVFQK